MRTRFGSHGDDPAADDALESWIRDLGTADPDGSPPAAHDAPEHDCAVCCGTATGEIWFGPGGSLPGRLSA